MSENNRKTEISDKITEQFCLVCYEIIGKGTGSVTLKGMIKYRVGSVDV
ncbi:hypothetical protein NKS27_01760 [Peribacillus frigoritolerans]|nr:hypothetical protein [Peribacillus frigoritolerans]MCP1151161.1 hypothetical protein [Peribacillus frigoritolerans]